MIEVLKFAGKTVAVSILTGFGLTMGKNAFENAQDAAENLRNYLAKGKQNKQINH